MEENMACKYKEKYTQISRVYHQVMYTFVKGSAEKIHTAQENFNKYCKAKVYSILSTAHQLRPWHNRSMKLVTSLSNCDGWTASSECY